MQEYVSKELSHFVGRSLHSNDERMKLLVLIIKSGQLIANIKNSDNPTIQTSFRYKAERLGEVYEQNDIVCFCDIPRSQLKIHTSKYSEFGISFCKSFVGKQGTRPVMYVPINFEMMDKTETINSKKPEEYFTSMHNQIATLGVLILFFSQSGGLNTFFQNFKEKVPKQLIEILDQRTIEKIENEDSYRLIFSLQSALLTQLAFVKLFDAQLEDIDEDNYYLEREWRNLNNLDFNLSDIKCVFLPNEKYKAEFKSLFPLYDGDFHLFHD